MNRLRLLALILLLVVWCYGQDSIPASTQAGSQNATAHVTGHGAFPVKVTKTLDSSKLKDGDSVEVETAGGFKLPDGTLIPKGSKLAGHVTGAKARSKGDAQSELAISFEKLNLPNGKQLSVKGVVQAAFPPAEEIDPGVVNGPVTMAHGATPGYVPTGDIKSGSNMEASGKPQATMDPKSVGVQGIHELELRDGGVLTSKGKQVKLNSGVRMIVHVDILE